jgi:predicted dehydrogenase
MTECKRRDFLKTTVSATLGLAASAHLPARSARGSAKPARKIKIGQIGTGHAHAGGKMSTLRKLTNDFQVVGLVEPDAQRQQAMARHAAYRDLPMMTEEQLLNTPGLEAVAVETEVRDLVPTAARCIAAGMHLHLDKPAGESLGQFKAALDGAARSGLVVQMGYMFRTNPAFQFCFRAVRDGWLGEVFEAHGVVSKTIPASRRAGLARYPGGSMFELGCHLIDALVYALGKPEEVAAYIRRTRPDQDSLADNCLAVFEYPKATCTIRSALLEVEGFRRRQFVVCGDQGTIDIRPLEPPRLLLALVKSRDPYRAGYQEVELPAMPGRYDDQLVDLARTIRGEKENDFPYSHDLAVQEAILRASGLPTD